MKVFVLNYETESGDKGVAGVFNFNPTVDDLFKIVEQDYPAEIGEDGHISIMFESTEHYVQETMRKYGS